MSTIIRDVYVYGLGVVAFLLAKNQDPRLLPRYNLRLQTFLPPSEISHPSKNLTFFVLLSRQRRWIFVCSRDRKAGKGSSPMQHHFDPLRFLIWKRSKTLRIFGQKMLKKKREISALRLVRN